MNVMPDARLPTADLPEKMSVSNLDFFYGDIAGAEERSTCRSTPTR